MKNTSEEIILKLRETLSKIAKWEMPSTGKFWDKEKTRPISYEADYGSNGTRDYIKSIAIGALEETKSYTSQFKGNGEREFGKIDLERMYLLGLLNRENLDMDTLSKELEKARTKVNLAFAFIQSLTPSPHTEVKEGEGREERAINLLNECRIQLEYLNDKFKPTATTNLVLSVVNQFLSSTKPK